MAKIRLTLDLDGEVLEVWDLTEWNLDTSIAAAVLMDDLREEVRKARERISLDALKEALDED